MTYFLKKLQHQELGSLTPGKSKASRGKYIYISKNTDILSFFPPLSKDIKNDKTTLKVIPIFHDTEEIRECNFVYNNDYYHKPTGTRGKNEYRFYFKKILENDFLTVKANDILIMRSKNILEYNNDNCLSENIVYYLDIVQPTDSDYYLFCNNLIQENTNKRNSSAVLYDGTIIYFEEKLKRLTSQSPTSPSLGITGDSHSKKNLSVIPENQAILDMTKNCMLTGTIISAGSFNNLDLYKINPYDVGSLYNNSLVFSKDIGWAFTNGLFTLSNELEVIVHPDVKNSLLTLYHGKKISLDDYPSLQLNSDNLSFHREQIFGSFKKAARLI